MKAKMKEREKWRKEGGVENSSGALLSWPKFSILSNRFLGFREIFGGGAIWTTVSQNSPQPGRQRENYSTYPLPVPAQSQSSCSSSPHLTAPLDGVTSLSGQVLNTLQVQQSHLVGTWLCSSCQLAPGISCWTRSTEASQDYLGSNQEILGANLRSSYWSKMEKFSSKKNTGSTVW